MAFSAFTSFALRASMTPQSPVSGQVSAVTEFDLSLAEGTTANKADLAHKSIQSIAASGNSDIDFRALEDTLGDVMDSLAEVVALVFESPATNGDALSIKPASSNGWTALLADASDVITLKPGARVILYAPADGAYPVGATNKSINVANADSTAANLTLTLIGRSA